MRDSWAWRNTRTPNKTSMAPYSSSEIARFCISGALARVDVLPIAGADERDDNRAEGRLQGPRSGWSGSWREHDVDHRQTGSRQNEAPALSELRKPTRPSQVRLLAPAPPWTPRSGLDVAATCLRRSHSTTSATGRAWHDSQLSICGREFLSIMTSLGRISRGAATGRRSSHLARRSCPTTKR